MSLDLESFTAIVKEDAALRGRATLQPIGDDGDKVFPPTHAVDEKKLRAEDPPGRSTLGRNVVSMAKNETVSFWTQCSHRPTVWRRLCNAYGGLNESCFR